MSQKRAVAEAASTAQGAQGAKDAQRAKGAQGASRAAEPLSEAAQSRRARDRRVIRTKKAIREAFMRLMERQDYSKITIAAIAREADIDRKTFYLHYRSVEDLAEELIREHAEAIVSMSRDAMLNGSGSIDVTALFTQMTAGLNPGKLKSRHMVSHVSIEDILTRMEGPFIEALEEDNPFGIKPDDPRLSYWVTFFCAGLLAVYRKWSGSDGSLSIDDLAESTRIALAGGVDGVVSYVTSEGSAS